MHQCPLKEAEHVLVQVQTEATCADAITGPWHQGFPCDGSLVSKSALGLCRWSTEIASWPK